MFERFSEPARQVIVLAQDEARTLRHNYIGTEHLLLGLLREGGDGAKALSPFDITHGEIQAQVARIVGHGDDVTTDQIPFTPRAKKVLELSMREALRDGASYIGPEHILVGLVDEGEGVAAKLLTDYAPLKTIRAAALDLDAAGRAGGAFTPSSPPLAAEVLEELNRVRVAREEAVAGQQLDQAERMRAREQRLRKAARNLQRAWLDEEPVFVLDAPTFASRQVMRTEPSLWRGLPSVLIGWLLFAVSLGVGLLIGWSLWGR